MTKQQAKEQRRKAKKLAKVLNELPASKFIYRNSISIPGDGVMALEISIYWNGEWYTATGAAKCNRVDTWNEGLGVDIATGRALLRIAYQILKDEEVNEVIKEPGILESSVKSITEEYGNVKGVIYTKTGPGPKVMFHLPGDGDIPHEEPSPVPGSAKYRGFIQPEVVPTGLEVIKKKGEQDGRESDNS